MIEIAEYWRDDCVISTDHRRLDLDVIHNFLANSYWAKGVPKDIVRRSVEHALCFGVYDKNSAQIGFARVVSDFATIAYVGDVFVLETQRGRGLGKWLMECIVAHPALQGLRRWILTTRDAHEIYAHVGFTPVKWPERYMELFQPDVYGAR